MHLSALRHFLVKVSVRFLAVRQKNLIVVLNSATCVNVFNEDIGNLLPTARREKLNSRNINGCFLPIRLFI